MHWDHPGLNAILNGTSAVFLLCGWIAIRFGMVQIHWPCMVAAFTSSTLFLASYIARYATTGTHYYVGSTAGKAVYLTLLFSHMACAVALLPMVLVTLRRAIRADYERHRAIARWTWPLWMYTSVTGVIVYFMLYR